MKKAEIMLAVLVLIGIVVTAWLASIALADRFEPKPYFTKEYMMNRYNIAGTEDYIYVVDFQFDCSKEMMEWLRKYEELRRK